MLEKAFHIFTVGWEPSFIKLLGIPMAARTGMHFTYGLLRNSRQLPLVERSLPGADLVALSKPKTEPLPPPDYELLASLECVGVPTIRSMVQGDRVLRLRPEHQSLGYATLLARRIREVLCELQPDLVLGSFDSLHSSMSLAVSKSFGIPWATMSFSTIPQNLTAFCRGMTPNSLLPITRCADNAMRLQAEETMEKVRANRQQVLAYRPPASFTQRARQFLQYSKNLATRSLGSRAGGYDRFTWFTAGERLTDIARRSLNEVLLPTSRMLGSPPEKGFAYFPLHMAPEATVDSWAPFYQNQLALAFQLALSLPSDLEFVVKLHFGDPDNYSRQELLELMKLPRVRIAHPSASGFAFLRRASLVFGITGTACLEAALLGKPVLMFGDSPYQYFPRTERARRPDQLYEQIRRMLQLPSPSDEEVVEAFVAYMARYMPGRINDWKRPIVEDEFVRLADCFRALRSYVESPPNREHWYDRPPFQAPTA